MRRTWLLLLSLSSCAVPGRPAAEPFAWRPPWKVGDRFEITRSEDVFVAPEALNVDESILPSFGWKNRVVFHGVVTGERDGALKVELVVASAVSESSWGGRKSTGSYERGKETAEERNPGLLRVYACEVDRRGVLTHWEDRLDALACLHGLGGEFYNVFSSLLVEPPAGPILPGHAWSTGSAVNIAHCDQIRFRLNCRLEADSAGGHVVAGEAFQAESAARLGTGRWRFSSDLRQIEGTLALELIQKGRSTMRWRDEVAVRPR